MSEAIQPGGKSFAESQADGFDPAFDRFDAAENLRLSRENPRLAGARAIAHLSRTGCLRDRRAARRLAWILAVGREEASEEWAPVEPLFLLTLREDRSDLWNDETQEWKQQRYPFVDDLPCYQVEARPKSARFAAPETPLVSALVALWRGLEGWVGNLPVLWRCTGLLMLVVVAVLLVITHSHLSPSAREAEARETERLHAQPQRPAEIAEEARR